MKKFADIFLVFLLTACAVFVSYFMAEKAVKTDRSAVALATVSKVAVTERGSDRKLLVENNKKDYHFYKQDNNVILVHKGVDYTFENWSRYIDVEKPELYFRKLDGDKKDTIIIKLVDDINDDGSYVYGVYALTEIVRENGTIKYKVNAMTRSSTKQIVDEKVKIEISQSKECKKIGYAALCYSFQEMAYDRKTGVPTGYYNPFHTLQDESGNYLTISSWERGAAEYTVEDDGIFVTFPINVKYKETSEVQQAGFVKCMLSITKDSKEVFIVNQTMSFKPNMEYGAYKYDYDNKEWQSVWKNANKSAGGDKVIDYIQYDATVASELETDDFSKNSSDLNKLGKIVVLQDGVKLYAKKGYKFSQKLVKRKEYSLLLTLNNVQSNNYDVAYTAEISQSDKGAEILTIKFDQPYKRDNISKLKINFGVK